jgi:hypothetical protein
LLHVASFAQTMKLLGRVRATTWPWRAKVLAGYWALVVATLVVAVSSGSGR